MENCFSSEHYQSTAVIPLPFVNLAPSNPSTIYTVLLYAAQEGAKHGQRCIMVTFDQPLYAKAYEIVLSSPPDSPLQNIFIRLGGFHLLLSFFGCIGHVMAGSGLEELWSTVYAKNSVIHMMSGKAYSRSVRALFLTEEALFTVFLQAHENSFPNKEELKDIYISLINGTTHPHVLLNSQTVTKFVKHLEKHLSSTSERGRTQTLWIHFLEMVELVRMFVRAERSGDFFLHLYCVAQMLPYFHSCGHFNYAKSAQLYLQSSLQLLGTLNDEEFETFVMQGQFTIRRREKCWYGIWSDLAIEQVLMRSLKTSGGLTQGRGITPSTIATWIKSMPATSRIIEAMEEFAGVEATSSEQHVDLREAHQRRDANDIQTFVAWFQEHNPFEKSPELSSLSTGVLASDSLDCDRAFEKGVAAIGEIEAVSYTHLDVYKRQHPIMGYHSMS